MVIVDTIKTKYQELFTVKLLHSAYEKIFTYKDPITHLEKSVTTSSIFEELFAEPDIHTKNFFDNHNVDYKCGNNMMICFTRSESAKPYIQFAEPVRIRFMLFSTQDFVRKTNVEAVGSTSLYQFTNKDRTGDAANKFLTKNATGVESADLKTIREMEVEKNCFAVIDIFTDVADANFGVFDGGNLVSPVYTILFNKHINP